MERAVARRRLALGLEPAVALGPLLAHELGAGRHRRRCYVTLQCSSGRRGQRRLDLGEDPLAELVAGPGEREGDVGVQALQAAVPAGPADAELERGTVVRALAARRELAPDARAAPRSPARGSRPAPGRPRPPATSARRRRPPRAARRRRRGAGRSGSRWSGTARPAASYGSCSVTAGRPNGQRTATRRKARGSRPSCRATTARSSIAPSVAGASRATCVRARDATPGCPAR